MLGEEEHDYENDERRDDLQVPFDPQLTVLEVDGAGTPTADDPHPIVALHKVDAAATIPPPFVAAGLHPSSKMVGGRFNGASATVAAGHDAIKSQGD